MAFAEKTKVAVEKSQQELERLITMKGASRYAVEKDIAAGVAIVRFLANHRLIKFVLKLPKMPVNGTPRSMADYEQICRQRWRALLLCVKAKFESVQSRISDFEQEFMAFTVMDNAGRTASEIMLPQLAKLYQEGGLIGLPAPKPEA